MFCLLPPTAQQRTLVRNVPAHRAFTLIELLVVIAIILLLSAILFPVFARARENARKTACLSNVRQLATGFMQYFQDYDEQFPLLGKNGAKDTSWVFTMQPYIKSTQSLRCPSDNSTQWLDHGNWFDANVTTLLDGVTKVRRTSYALNGYLPAGNSNPGQGGNFPALSDIQKSGNLIFLVETPSTFTEPYFHAHVWNPPASTSHWDSAKNRPDDVAYERHMGGFNAGFLDGHTKWVTWEQAWVNRDPSVGGQTVTYVNSSGTTVTAVTPPMKGMFDPRQY